MKSPTRGKRKSSGQAGELHTDHWRIRLLKFVIYFVAVCLFARLLQIQVFKHTKYQAIAREQYTREYEQQASRGLIYDRKFTVLTLNKERYDLGIHKSSVADISTLCIKLAGLLDTTPATLRKKLQAKSNFILLQRDLDKDIAETIQLLKIPGAKITKCNERLYPYKETLAQVIGFSDVDGNGLSGIELKFDSILKGKNGWSILQKDARGRSIMPITSLTRESQQGDNLILTIDHNMQTIAEEELSQTVKEYGAKDGTVIITNPATGEILAMASVPGFDANSAGETNPNAWRIRSITDIFEPGSTFKIVTMMQALRDTIVKDNEIFFCENGSFKLFGEIINDPRQHAWLSFENIFKLSSNIGAAKIALKHGKEKLFQAARDLGFGNKTGIELPGEVSGILKNPATWSRFTPAAISYGHEVAVTALQMAMAYGTIANGGLLMKPAIIKEIHGPQSELKYEHKPQVIRKVMRARVAAKMIAILKQVVDDGTGKLAKLPNISLAGKTGTAQKPLIDRRGYSNTNFVASFVGFYPAEQARLLIYVSIDEPYPVHSGGKVAAPAVRKILKRILNIYKTPAPAPITDLTRLTASKKSTIPYLVGRRIEIAQKIFEDLDIKYTTEGQGTYIKGQKIMQELQKNQIILELQPCVSDSGYSAMPGLVGLSLRKAIVELSTRGLLAKINGSGLVTAQQPEIGSKMKIGSRCYLECKPVVSVNLLVN